MQWFTSNTIQLHNNQEVVLLESTGIFSETILSELAQLNPLEEAELSQKIKPRRVQQYLKIRALLNHYFGEKVVLNYTSKGAPYLEGSKYFISISHTADIVVVAISTVQIGVDIESQFEKAFRLQDRFSTEQERILFDDSPEIIATKIWCAKEALFKVNQISFDFNQLEISVKDGVGYVAIVDGKSYSLRFQRSSHYVLGMVMA